jgi:hypothetical protein
VSGIEVEVVEDVTPELVEAAGWLLPQLSGSAARSDAAWSSPPLLRGRG